MTPTVDNQGVMAVMHTRDVQVWLILFLDFGKELWLAVSMALNNSSLSM